MNNLFTRNHALEKELSNSAKINVRFSFAELDLWSAVEGNIFSPGEVKK